MSNPDPGTIVLASVHPTKELLARLRRRWDAHPINKLSTYVAGIAILDALLCKQPLPPIYQHLIDSDNIFPHGKPSEDCMWADILYTKWSSAIVIDQETGEGVQVEREKFMGCLGRLSRTHIAPGIRLYCVVDIKSHKAGTEKS